MLYVKKHHYIYGIQHEDKGKDEQKGSENLLVARSITYMDDSQEILTEKREYIEPEHTMAYG